MSGPSSASTSITTLSNRPGEFQHSATGMTSGSNGRDAGSSTRGFRRKGMERAKSLAELESGMVWKGSTTFSPGRVGVNLDKPPMTPTRTTSPAPFGLASSYGADADDEYRQPSGSATSPISITSTPSPATSPLPRPRARIHYSSPIPRTAFTPTRFLREGSAHNASPSPSTPFITNKQAGEEDRPIHPFFNRDFRRTKSVPLPAGPPPRANKPRMVAYYSSTSASSSQTSTQTSAQHSSQEHEAGPSSRLNYARDAGPTPGKGLWKTGSTAIELVTQSIERVSIERKSDTSEEEEKIQVHPPLSRRSSTDVDDHELAAILDSLTLEQLAEFDMAPSTRSKKAPAAGKAKAPAAKKVKVLSEDKVQPSLPAQPMEPLATRAENMETTFQPAPPSARSAEQAGPSGPAAGQIEIPVPAQPEAPSAPPPEQPAPARLAVAAGRQLQQISSSGSIHNMDTNAPIFHYRNLAKPPKIVYTSDMAEANTLLKGLKGSILGFDMEWPIFGNKDPLTGKPVGVRYVNGKREIYQPPTALIQVGDEKLVVLVQIWGAKKLPPMLVSILQNPKIYKTGVNIKMDGYKLIRDYPDAFPKGMKSLLELSRMARHVDPILTGPGNGVIAFAKLVRAYLDQVMPKDPDVRCNGWMTKLTKVQVDYAANDVVAANELYEVFARLALEQNIKLDLDSYSDHVATEDVIRPAGATTAPAAHGTSVAQSTSGSPYMSPSHRAAMDLYKTGKSLDEIASIRSIKSATAQGYLIRAMAVSPNELNLGQKKKFLSTIPADSGLWLYNDTKDVLKKLAADVGMPVPKK